MHRQCTVEDDPKIGLYRGADASLDRPLPLLCLGCSAREREFEELTGPAIALVAALDKNRVDVFGDIHGV